MILFFVISFFTSFKQTTDKIEVNQPILTENLNGNLFYGFTPDWVNYFQMSEWISKNINKDSVVACRKPSMAFIYSKGHPFYGIYSLPQLDADTVINNMVKRNADVVIIDQMDLLKKLPPNISMQIRPYISRVIFGNDKAYLICELPQPLKTELTGVFANLKITAMYDLNAFFQNIKAGKKDYFAENPDYLLNMLRKNHVSYAILASIRRFSSQKTGDIIDTVHRFLYLIELKYPNVFKKIYQIGNENNEPATLISITYPKNK